jgi:large subunit ribosomal protein L4
MTQNLSVFNLNGDLVEGPQIDMPLEVAFGSIHPHAMHARMVYELDTRRSRTHKTKTMSEVHGSTRKIVKQKGTGGARHGSRKAPIFRHGGISHGRLPGGRVKRLNKKVMTLGLHSAVSFQFANGKFIVVDSLRCEAFKTRSFVQGIEWIRDLARKSNAAKNKPNILPRILFVDEAFENNFRLASANAKHVDVLPFCGLNVNSLLKSDCVVVSVAALQKMINRFHGENIESYE